jgi:hypothetical protein
VADPTSTDQNYTIDPESARSAAEKIARTFPIKTSRDVISDYVAKHTAGLSPSTLGIAESFLKGEKERLANLGIYENLKMLVYTPPPPNPAYETNGQLYKMNAKVEELAETAERQAELIQALNEAAKATLELAYQASQEAKASTELARTSTEISRSSLKLTRSAVWIAIISPIFSAIIGIGVSVYLNARNNAANQVRDDVEKSLRQKELGILNDISGRLAADAKSRADAPSTVAPKQSAKPPQSSK